MEDEKRKEGEDAGQVHPAGEDWTPDSSIFIQMAESLRLQGRSEEAIETLRKGLEKMPDSLPGRLLLGRCLLEKGLFAEARKELETVARGVEECLPVYKMLSQVYLEEKDVDKALEVLRKTLYFQTAEETAGKKVTPLEMGLLHRGPHPPFVTPPSLVTPPAPQASPAPPSPRRPGSRLHRLRATKRRARRPYRPTPWRKFISSKGIWIGPFPCTRKSWEKTRGIRRSRKSSKP